MKSKLITLSLVSILPLSYSNYVLAHEGRNHNEAMEQNEQQSGSMMAAKDTAATAKAVEVGNKICPVTGDKIPAPGEKGTMGDDPIRYEYNGKIYNLCCKMCVKDFKKNPEKYSKIVEDEVAKEKMMQKKSK